MVIRNTQEYFAVLDPGLDSFEMRVPDDEDGLLQLIGRLVINLVESTGKRWVLMSWIFEHDVNISIVRQKAENGLHLEGVRQRVPLLLELLLVENQAF